MAADSPVWQAVTQRARAQGFGFIQSFNDGFERFLPRARGADLVVTCVGARLLPPAETSRALLPMEYEEIQARIEKEGAGVARRRLDDGTRVTLLYGRDPEAVLRIVEKLDLAP